MEIVGTIREIWQRKLALLIVAGIALVAALMAVYRLPSFEKRSVALGSASSQILIDSPNSTLLAGLNSEALATLATRARIYAQYLSSLEARQRIARASGVPAQEITSNGPFSTDTGRRNYEPQSAEARASDIVEERRQHRLVFIAQDDVPIITVSALAPTAREAVRLADASVVALKEYVAKLSDCPAGSWATTSGPARAANCRPGQPGVVVRELGVAEGGTIGGRNGLLLFGFAFLVVFALGCVVLAVVPGVARYWRELDWAERVTQELRADEPSAGTGARTNGGRDREAAEDREQRTASAVP